MIGTKEGLSIRDGKLWARDKRLDVAWGRSAFKLLHYMQANQGGIGAVRRFIEHTQRIWNREEVVFRVFIQTSNGAEGSWGKDPAGTSMFGSPPWDLGVWPIEVLKNLCRRGDRVKELTPLGKRLIETMFMLSVETGCIFEAVVDATLKHTDGLCTSVIDHCIRQTAAFCRKMQQQYPRACVYLNARNEWDAHNTHGTKLREVNMWASRFYRWSHPVNEAVISFASPGAGYVAEQWPEGIIIVDHGGRNTFDYDCGPEPGKFKLAAIHPERGGDWVAPPDMVPLRRDARGMPIASTESMYFVDARDKGRAENWYRNRAGWQHDVHKQMEHYENLRQAGFALIIVHDEKGVQGDPEWPRKETTLEAELANYFNVTQPPGKPEHKYERIIALAYQQILGRQPDPGGLAHYNEQMEAGMSEWMVRESMIRSDEYDNKN